MIKGLRTVCALKNCVYYNPIPDNPVGCVCSHPDRGYYAGNTTCPLYKAQWDSKAEAALAARFFKKQR